MALKIKITFTGGGNLGEDHLLDLAEPRLLGRTHSADVVVSKSDSDVSGRHLEFRADGDAAAVQCLSRNGFELNGDVVREGESRLLQKGDELRLGKRVRLRVDLIGETAARPDGGEDATFATRAASLTGATTFATRAASLTGATGAPAFGGTIVETPVGDAPSVASVGFTAPGASAGAAIADDAATMEADASTGDAAAAPLADADTPSFSGATGDGETQAMQTRVGNMDVIRAIAEEKQRAKRFKQRLYTVAAFGALAVLGALVYWRWPRAERWLQHPQPIIQHIVKSATGTTLFYVDYPKSGRTRVSERPNGGIDVETLTGTAKDVPMRLSLDVRRDVKEFGLSLEESAEREIEALRKLGYAFESVGSDGAFGFFERDYPKSCQGGTQRGVRFCRREFTRSEGTGQWHGYLIYFRNRDTAYCLLREIPEYEWPRGKWLLFEDPSLALYSSFLLDHWESPGDAALAEFAGRRSSDLLKAIDSALERNLPNEWKVTGHMIDALVVAGQKGDGSVLSEARTRLARFRKIRKLFYDECRARYEMGESSEAFAKAWGAFGDDLTDLRSRRLSDPKEWRRE